jgi:CRISPR type IV-associated protein Csf2
MKTYDFSGTITALSSIAHSGGQSIGIEQMLRREKFVLPDNSVEDIPLISGNGLRGMLRDRGMLHMCRALGYGINEESGEVRGLSLPAFYFLFSGGTLSSDSGKGLDINYARKLRELIPLTGIFGGALGNQILPGKLKIGKAIPICQETAHIIPDRFRSRATQTVWAFIQKEMYTRKDDGKNENYRPLLAGETRQLLDAMNAPKVKNEVQTDTGQNQQMMYFCETFAAGTPFYWRITLDDASDVELEAFLTTLVEFSKMPYVGGKSAAGLGEVSIQLDKWMTIDSRTSPQGEELSYTLGRKYADHLDQRAGEIRGTLATIR